MYQHTSANYHQVKGNDQQVFYEAKKTKARICAIQELARLLEKP